MKNFSKQDEELFVSTSMREIQELAASRLHGTILDLSSPPALGRIGRALWGMGMLGQEKMLDTLKEEGSEEDWFPFIIAMNNSCISPSQRTILSRSGERVMNLMPLFGQVIRSFSPSWPKLDLAERSMSAALIHMALMHMGVPVDLGLSLEDEAARNFQASWFLWSLVRIFTDEGKAGEGKAEEGRSQGEAKEKPSD